MVYPIDSIHVRDFASSSILPLPLFTLMILRKEIVAIVLNNVQCQNVNCRVIRQVRTKAGSLKLG